MILDLPTELLEGISKELGPIDQGQLRAVCRVLEDATQRVFFSRRVVRTGEHLLRSRDSDLELLRALAAGRTGWNIHARRIDFIPGPPRPQTRRKLAFLRVGGEKKRQSREQDAENLLKSALENMTNVRIVSWKLSYWELRSQREVIADFISRLSTLDEFGVDITDDPHSFTPPSVRGLRRLEFAMFPWQDDTSIRRPITNLIGTQEHLTCLFLHGRKDWTEVWVVLREARIKLTDITTNLVSPHLFRYLLSYTGLQKLHLGLQDAGCKAEDDRLADEFYDSVLPHHADSLIELSCVTRYESRFSFGEHNAHVVALLHRLRVLEMSVNAGEGVDLPSASQQLARLLRDPEFVGDSAALLHPTVNLLLETMATSLHDLRHLRMSTANVQYLLLA